MEPVVLAENLRKQFGTFTAVDGISFFVRPGECYGILGPNGAGKTSTIRMIYGFSPLSGGALHVLGQDVTNSRQLRKVKYRIGVCQQENNLDPDLSVLQNLEVFASYFDIPRSKATARAQELLKFIALENRKDTSIAELSGGLMRRIVLARALINEPDLLILDEPTTGLDPQSRHQIWERLEGLRARGITILLTTHYMEEASRLCDRLIIVDHGKILVEGRPLELIREHAGRDIIEVAEPDAKLRSFVKERNLRHDDLGHRLLIYCGERDQLYREVSDYCRDGCTLRTATLEDVFLKLTGRDLRE
ncbi:MAG TPA: ATP-binding cassette domain-containing protein [Syntrophales bacterium]|nr:ATP-binding cassette domain-containing protein [Syntrophales bacterium]